MATTLDRLIGHYGVTDSPYAGGFILPDGSFLDFSEGSGSRSQDHRNVEWATKKQFSSRTDALYHIMEQTGIIRWLPEAWQAEIRARPTLEQVRTLSDLADTRAITIEVSRIRQRFFRSYDRFEEQEVRRDLRAIRENW